MQYICEQRMECQLGHVCHHAEPHEVTKLPTGLGEMCNEEAEVNCPKKACVPVVKTQSSTEPEEARPATEKEMMSAAS